MLIFITELCKYLSILATTSQSYSFGTQSDFQSGVDKQKNQLTLDLMGQNLALC